MPELIRAPSQSGPGREPIRPPRGVEQWEPFDLADVAGQVIYERRQEAERRGIHLQAALTAAPATGDPSLAESLVANLVDNAIRHNVPGGRAEVSTTMTDGRAVVRVTNSGTLIPPAEVDRLFQPFQQLGHERIRHGDRYGLGLAIVRAIATAHKATITATTRSEGGLDLEVSFPLRVRMTRLREDGSRAEHIDGGSHDRDRFPGAAERIRGHPFPGRLRPGPVP
jgi:signal transduction histidine kinase